MVVLHIQRLGEVMPPPESLPLSAVNIISLFNGKRGFLGGQLSPPEIGGE